MVGGTQAPPSLDLDGLVMAEQPVYRLWETCILAAAGLWGDGGGSGPVKMVKQAFKIDRTLR